MLQWCSSPMNVYLYILSVEVWYSLSACGWINAVGCCPLHSEQQWMLPASIAPPPLPPDGCKWSHFVWNVCLSYLLIYRFLPLYATAKVKWLNLAFFKSGTLSWFNMLKTEWLLPMAFSTWKQNKDLSTRATPAHRTHSNPPARLENKVK